MKIQKYLWIFCCLAFLLSACVDSNSAGRANLEGHTWVLTNLKGEAPLDGQQLNINFESGQIYGNAGCNRYGSSYQIKDDTITVDGLFSTEMACLEPDGIMEQEQIFLSLLRSANRFTVLNGVLTLFVDSEPELIFEMQ